MLSPRHIQGQCPPRGHFTPCARGARLLKPLPAAVKIAFRDEFFPAGSHFEQFRDDSHRHGVYMRPVRETVLRGMICPSAKFVLEFRGMIPGPETEPNKHKKPQRQRKDAPER
jgi:hypothetical protein